VAQASLLVEIPSSLVEIPSPLAEIPSPLAEILHQDGADTLKVAQASPLV